METNNIQIKASKKINQRTGYMIIYVSDSYKEITSCKTANNLPATKIHVNGRKKRSKQVKYQKMNWINDNDYFKNIQSDH